MTALSLPAIHASHSGCWLRDGGGTTRSVGKGDAIMAAADTPLLMLNAPMVATRLGYPDLSGLDLLELFAFIHPARFMVPTPIQAGGSPLRSSRRAAAEYGETSGPATASPR